MFSANLAYGYTNVEIKKACDAEWGAFAGIDPGCAALGVADGGSLRGKSTPNAPEHTLSAGVQASVPVTRGLRWTARLDYLYESERYAQTFNLASTGDSSIINVRTGIEGEQSALTAWVKNLTDEDSANSVIRIVDFNTFFARRAFQASYQRGRQVGVSFEVDFDWGG